MTLRSDPSYQPARASQTQGLPRPGPSGSEPALYPHRPPRLRAGWIPEAGFPSAASGLAQTSWTKSWGRRPKPAPLDPIPRGSDVIAGSQCSARGVELWADRALACWCHVTLHECWNVHVPEQEFPDGDAWEEQCQAARPDAGVWPGQPLVPLWNGTRPGPVLISELPVQEGTCPKGPAGPSRAGRGGSPVCIHPLRSLPSRPGSRSTDCTNAQATSGLFLSRQLRSLGAGSGTPAGRASGVKHLECTLVLGCGVVSALGHKTPGLYQPCEKRCAFGVCTETPHRTCISEAEPRSEIRARQATLEQHPRPRSEVR